MNLILTKCTIYSILSLEKKLILFCLGKYLYAIYSVLMCKSMVHAPYVE
jgi:hypothetical protein